MMNTFQFYFKKADQSVEIDWESLGEKSQEYAIAYGLRQLLADSFAGAKTQSEAEAMLWKRLEAFKAGTIGQRSLGGKSELEKEMLTQLRALLRGKVKGLSGEALEQAALEAFGKLNPDQKAKLEAKAEASLQEKARQRAQEKAALGDLGDLLGL